ncbi:MAG: hypothetical protein IPJ19_14200 [Planctomycetes bacterium]|nr:hypothetical protein [Planctomycetota bacterium]
MELLGIRFLAPGFLALLALPIAALVLGARGGAVRALFTGTLEAWRAAERAHPSAERRKRRVPLALACLALALCLGAFALAQPEHVRAEAPRRFLLIVDRSQGMYLTDGGRTRLEHALEPLRAWIATQLRRQDELVWIDEAWPEGLVERDVPAELLRTPRARRAAPDWARYDRADALWISARFDTLPVRAGYSASGGAAVPGAIGREGRARLDWDGERVVRVEDAYGEADLGVFVDTRLPEPLRALAQLWAGSEGFALRATREESELFEFVLESEGAARELELARDGWSARATIGPALVPTVGEASWLSAGGPCVLAAPGRVRTSIRALEPPAGDPAAFAVSWGELFDSLRLQPVGVVPIEARSAQGAAAWRAPAASVPLEQGEARPLGGWLALAAAVCALGAWVVRALRA